MSSEPIVIKWLLDTRLLWRDAKETSHLSTQASRALALLTEQERASVLKYHFVKDAKLALGSALLKRHAISSFCQVPWHAAQFTRDAHTKPIFRLPGTSSEPLIFNVSHQAGLVAIFAVNHPPAGLSIGVDIVCPSERRTRDHELVIRDGWPRYVDMHDSVFSPAEAQRLKWLPIADRDTKLAYFYTLWCLREAYVKMTGEALLADWLRDLDLRYYAPPGEEPPEQRDFEIWFNGGKVQDVDLRVEWFSGEYIICTAVRGNRDAGLVMDGNWTLLDLNQVLDAAEKAY